MIDWFTVVAQIVNFLILVGLLRYFLYGRIVAAIEQRQKELAARWEEAQQQRDAAEEELKDAREKNRQLDGQREQLLAQIRDEVERQRQELTASLRGEVEEQRRRWSDAIREERSSFLRHLRRRASEEVCAIARRALADLADATLERQIVEHFLRQVEQLTDQQRQAVITSLDAAKGETAVQTSHRLPDDQQQAIVRALHTHLRHELNVRFEESDDLLCGIALQTNAHKLAWDLRDYLLTLEQELQQALDEATVSHDTIRHEPITTE